MSESGWLWYPPVGLIALGLVSACAVVITVTMVIVARDVRRALAHLNAMVPECRRALGQMDRSLTAARRILATVERGTRQVERVVARAADTAGGAIDRLAAWKDDAAAFFAGRVRNGVGSEPHRRYRKS